MSLVAANGEAQPEVVAPVPPLRGGGCFPDRHYSPGKLYTQFRISDGKTPIAWRKTKVFQAESPPGSGRGASVVPSLPVAPCGAFVPPSGAPASRSPVPPAPTSDRLFRANVPASRLLLRLQQTQAIPPIMQRRSHAALQRCLLALVQPPAPPAESELARLRERATISDYLPEAEELAELERRYAARQAARGAGGGRGVHSGRRTPGSARGSRLARTPGASAKRARHETAATGRQPVNIVSGVTKKGRQLYLPARLRDPASELKSARRSPKPKGAEGGSPLGRSARAGGGAAAEARKVGASARSSHAPRAPSRRRRARREGARGPRARRRAAAPPRPPPRAPQKLKLGTADDGTPLSPGGRTPTSPGHHLSASSGKPSAVGVGRSHQAELPPCSERAAKGGWLPVEEARALPDRADELVWAPPPAAANPGPQRQLRRATPTRSAAAAVVGGGGGGVSSVPEDELVATSLEAVHRFVTSSCANAPVGVGTAASSTTASVSSCAGSVLAPGAAPAGGAPQRQEAALRLLHSHGYDVGAARKALAEAEPSSVAWSKVSARARAHARHARAHSPPRPRPFARAIFRAARVGGSARRGAAGGASLQPRPAALRGQRGVQVRGQRDGGHVRPVGGAAARTNQEPRPGCRALVR